MMSKENEMSNKKKPEDIVKILHSITELSIANGELDVWFDKNPNPSSPSSFVPESFTRDLLELIELHLLGHLNQE